MAVIFLIVIIQVGVNLEVGVVVATTSVGRYIDWPGPVIQRSLSGFRERSSCLNPRSG